LSNEQQHIYGHEHPETDRKRAGGFTLWFTGLSGSGKTTIAHIVGPAIEERGPIVEYLDGDTVRNRLSKGLGFSREDRDANIERIGWVASRLTRQGAAVIASAISPYAEARAQARGMVEEYGPFVEVFVDVSVEEAARRDTKGLYEKAMKGEIQNFTGVNDPYEPPEGPDVRVDTDTESAPESARRIIAFLEQKNLIPARTAPVRASGPVEGTLGNRAFSPARTEASA
jgi:adenylylsulfate kinase